MKNAAPGKKGGVRIFGSAIRGRAMEVGQNFCGRNAPSRPALAKLVGAMAQLSRPRRIEIVVLGRKARAAKLPRIRRLTREAAAEARRLAREAAQ
jgi:hypothetical protein